MPFRAVGMFARVLKAMERRRECVGVANVAPTLHASGDGATAPRRPCNAGATPGARFGRKGDGSGGVILAQATPKSGAVDAEEAGRRRAVALGRGERLERRLPVGVVADLREPVG
jgi:hypothetical protein